MLENKNTNQKIIKASIYSSSEWYPPKGWYVKSMCPVEGDSYDVFILLEKIQDEKETNSTIA